MTTIFNHGICEALLKWHPEMILISESPVTWQGFLIIPKSSYAAHEVHYPRVKLKLVVPNYPSLHNMQVRFGKQIIFLRNKELCSKVKELINTVQTVSSFLTQLQSLIVSIKYYFFSLFYKFIYIYILLYIYY